MADESFVNSRLRERVAMGERGEGETMSASGEIETVNSGESGRGA